MLTFGLSATDGVQKTNLANAFDTYWGRDLDTGLPISVSDAPAWFVVHTVAGYRVLEGRNAPSSATAFSDKRLVEVIKK